MAVDLGDQKREIAAVNDWQWFLLPKVRKICYSIEARRIPFGSPGIEAGKMRWEMRFETLPASSPMRRPIFFI
jgi:hypothetical protein